MMNVGVCPLVKVGDMHGGYRIIKQLYNKYIGGTCHAYYHVAILILNNSHNDFSSVFIHPGKIHGACEKECPLRKGPMQLFKAKWGDVTDSELVLRWTTRPILTDDVKLTDDTSRKDLFRSIIEEISDTSISSDSVLRHNNPPETHLTRWELLDL